MGPCRAVLALSVPASGSQPTPHAVADKASSYSFGSTQGRAFDVAVKLGYGFADRWQLAFGYRTIEGGADVEQVYNFAWLHFAVASLRVAF